MNVRKLLEMTHGTAGRIMRALDDEQAAALVREISGFEAPQLAALREHVAELPTSALVWWPTMLNDGEVQDIGTLPEGLDIDHPVVTLAITVAAKAEIDLRFPLGVRKRPGTI